MYPRILIAVALVAPLVFANSTLGQEAKGPIKIVVGFPPGGAADAAARTLADRLKDELSQTVIVENRPGAGGRIAAELLKRSPADGATLLLAPMGTTIILPVVFSKLAYDPWKDFAHVSQIATFRLAFAVAPDTPARSMKEYVAWAKANPGKASFGSAGAGTPPHLLGVMVAKTTGLELTHVAYKGGTPLVTDMVAGHIPAGTGTHTDFGELHRSGKLRILAIGGTVRSPALPDVPTFKELGYDIEGTSWIGIHAPAGTPLPTIERLALAISAVMRKTDVQDRFLKLGLDATGTSADQFVRIMENDKAKWEPVIRASGFKED